VDGIFRRKSGIYSARLVIPRRLRMALGKSELIASTGVRDHALAKAIAGALGASWRQHLLRLDGITHMDVLQISLDCNN
jgi:hypothetical protein